MSAHKSHAHLAALNAGLAAHRLSTDAPSQLSDAFRAGYQYAERTASCDEMQEWLAAMTSVSWDKATPELRAAVNSLLHALARASVGTAGRIELALAGIDKTATESPNGWWETSEGAKFGAERLAEVLSIASGRPTSLPEGVGSIGLDYARQSLRDHDAKYGRHPSTESSRNAVLQDVATLEAAAVLEALGECWVSAANLLEAAERLDGSTSHDDLAARASEVSERLKALAAGLPKPFGGFTSVNTAVFTVNIFGVPMRQTSDGSWETAVWPSDPSPNAKDPQ